jgi:hypothetical protein
VQRITSVFARLRHHHTSGSQLVWFPSSTLSIALSFLPTDCCSHCYRQNCICSLLEVFNLFGFLQNRISPHSTELAFNRTRIQPQLTLLHPNFVETTFGTANYTAFFRPLFALVSTFYCCITCRFLFTIVTFINAETRTSLPKGARVSEMLQFIHLVEKFYYF